MSLFPEPAAEKRSDPGRALLWAFFLASSWTWCIGMFLPVLLIRQYGLAGWILFALPNVLGAAAMGWTIQSRTSSLTMVTHHATATRAFSLVTIAFHAFFVPWLITQLLGVARGTLGFAVLAVLTAPLLATNLSVGVIAAAVWIVSALCMVGSAGADLLAIPRGSTPSLLDALGLGAVCALGFLTCPYLDLTFHRARQECATSTESKLAFGVGFGVLFLLMILFTLLYAGALGLEKPGAALRWLISIHVLVQAGFTTAIHTAALRASVDRPSGHGRMSRGILLAVAIGVLSAALGLWLQGRSWQLSDLPAGELIYRLFMAFYGLIFPAYVWICMFPARGFRRPHPRQLAVTGLAILVAAPFFWLAFIGRQMQWALVGVALVLAATALLDRVRRDWLAEQRSIMNEQGG